jgi:predicted aspartyl protease
MVIMRQLWVIALLVGAAVNLGVTDSVPQGTSPDPSMSPPVSEAEPLSDAEQPTEIVITAPEPRYVAPTHRDQIGRVWAPVYINGKGPFRLVLDTGSSGSGITLAVAHALGLKPDESAPVRLQGATGSLIVPTIRVDTLLVGDVLINGSKLPILKEAWGGAQGILGNEGLADRRVYIDFLHDLIIISRSHDQRAGAGFMTVPFLLERGRLLVAQVQLGHVHAKAIIDTGSQSTVGNIALRNALVSRHSRELPTVDAIQGVTAEIQEGEGHSAPPIELGPVEIRTQHMTFVDAYSFQYWHLTNEPALLIGMDALGTLDTLIIDYRRHEVQLRMREGT